ncbi:MAG: hypothetical protein KDJ52_21625 [Anaerolineae bacterium]|nr:hypothetical protein [Anaerolineae bacterium]
MPALKEFANLITVNMAELAAIYAQILVDDQAEFDALSGNHRPASARELLRTVVRALEQHNVQPLMMLFEKQTDTFGPLLAQAMLEALGKTLTPVAPSLEAGKFVWHTLAQVRADLIEQIRRAAVPITASLTQASDKTGYLPVTQVPLTSDKNGYALSRLSHILLTEVADEVKNGTDLESLFADLDEEDVNRTVLSIARLAQVELSMNSTLVDLPVYSFQVEADNLVCEVEKLLRAYTILPGVIITHNGLAIGVISRRKFFEQLGQLYGVAVFMRRPIRLMLNKINADPLLLPAACPVPDAIELTLNRPSNFVFEPIIVEIAPHTYRLLDVYTLLMAQSKLFSSLQRQLQLTNLELEKRVERRTAELVQANTDLTDEIQKRRRVEKELIVARDQALAASRFKTELLAKVSHELRTPLGAIVGHTEMIQVGIHGPVTEKQDQVAAKIVDNANYLAELVGQLLDQAQSEAGQLQLKRTVFTPANLLDTSLSRLGITAQNKGLTLHAEIDPQLPPQLSGDPVRLQQIVVNLVGNAVKYTEHGQVRVRLSCFGAWQWAIEVADTGPGIASEHQERIFEPFGQANPSMTRRQAGIGLGLSIVKQLVALMGGKIDLKSTIGQGSTFTVILPIEPILKETL